MDLDEVAVEAVERVAERASRQGIELVVAAAERCQVRGDASWLTQLALNLLDNALRHTPRGGRVSIGVSEAADGVTLVVGQRLRDRPEHQPHLFERFYRVYDARSRETGGGRAWACHLRLDRTLASRTSERQQQT